MSKIDAKRGDLLVEFFSEEIPARFQVESGEQLENLFVKKLVSREVSFGSCKTYTGPRHLAIIIRDIDLVQKDQLVEKRGPRLGSDEKAINGFLKSNNISLSDTIVKNTNNGDYIITCPETIEGETYLVDPQTSFVYSYNLSNPEFLGIKNKQGTISKIEDVLKSQLVAV